MAVKPNFNRVFYDLLTSWGGSLVRPDSAIITSGWEIDGLISEEHSNWWFDQIVKWLKYFETFTDELNTNKASFQDLSNYFPVGIIIKYAGSTEPNTSWRLLNGQNLSRAGYPVLYNWAVANNLIGAGKPFGTGNGSTTFSVPDVRGRGILGAGQGVDLTNRLFASVSGEETVLLTEAQTPRHRHYMPNQFSSYVTRDGGPHATGAYEGSRDYTDYTGGNTPHNNMQPYLALSYLIKAV